MRASSVSRSEASEADRPFLLSIFIGLAAATIGTGAIAAAMALTMIQ